MIKPFAPLVLRLIRAAARQPLVEYVKLVQHNYTDVLNDLLWEKIALQCGENGFHSVLKRL